MENIFRLLIESKIEQFERDYIHLSRNVFLDKSGKLIHPGEFGIYREKMVKDFLLPFLPSRLDIGSGFIITSNNNVSTQCDIIIYDKNNTPLIENGEQRFFPIECVAGVIEVKSKLSKKQFQDALIKLAKIKELKNDIPKNNLYLFKDFNNALGFNPKLNVKDQMATILICESIDVDMEKEINSIFSSTYHEVDKSLYHNMILCLNNYCCLYNDDAHRPIYYPYYSYEKPTLKNEIIKPNIMGYKKEHILAFVNYFYMLISSVSILYMEITNYLGSTRATTTVIEE